MKKLMVMAVMVVGVASADLSVDWLSGGSGAMYDVGGSGGGGPFIEGAVAQLIWSSTPAVTAVGSYDLVGATTLADEWLLDDLLTGGFGQFSGGGGIFVDANAGGNDVSTGYLYTRVFQSAGAVNEWFYDIPMVGPGLPVYNEQDTATTISDGVYTAAYWIDGNGTSVIPEPATLGLMGVAGLGMFLARRKARR